MNTYESTSQNSLETCTRCGGRLELVGGTDPDNKGPNGEWEEEYECQSCGGIGWYEMCDDTWTARYRGVCRGVEQ